MKPSEEEDFEDLWARGAGVGLTGESTAGSELYLQKVSPLSLGI